MARTKSQQGQEAKADETATAASAEDAQEAAGQSSESAGTGATAAGADSAPSAPAGDDAVASRDPGTGGSGELDPDRLMPILILRDETIGGVDYRPGSTPELPASVVARLVARGVGDDSEKAIKAWRRSSAAAAAVIG